MLNLPDIQTGDDLRHKGAWLNAVKREVQRLGRITGDGCNILVADGAGGLQIKFQPSPQNSLPQNSKYSGPFAVVQKDSTTVTILGYHADEGRNWKNYIDVGLDAPLELAEQDVTISAAGWVYLALTQTAGAYNTPTAAFAATLPTQDNTHFYKRLAFVEFDSGAITNITQWVYGGIDYPGRAF